MDSKERSNISKQIWRETRSQLRQYRTTQTKERLQAFIDIKQRYNSVEGKLRMLESYVTSKEFQLNRELSRL